MTQANRVHSTPPLSTSVSLEPLGAPAESADSFLLQSAPNHRETEKPASESRKPAQGLSRRLMLAGFAVLPAAIPATAEAAADPIFTVIQSHRRLSAHVDAAYSISGNLTAGPEFEAADAISQERHDALINHADILICSEPATLAGAVALMRYVAGLEDWEQPAYCKRWETSDGVVMDWRQAFLDTVAGALETMQGGNR